MVYAWWHITPDIPQGVTSEGVAGAGWGSLPAHLYEPTHPRPMIRVPVGMRPGRCNIC